MTRRRPVLLLTALLAILTAGSIVYIPRSMLNPLKPLPAHAHIVYRSDAPGWFLSFFTGSAETPVNTEPLAWNLNPGFAGSAAGGPSRALLRILPILEESPLAVATVSLGGRSRRDTWAAVSAIGSRSVLLRWQLILFRPENIRPVRSYGAWAVWQYNDPALPAWMRVRFAVTDGLLIFSLSDDSHDIYYLLDTLDGRRPSLAGRKEHE